MNDYSILKIHQVRQQELRREARKIREASRLRSKRRKHNPHKA